MTILLAFLIGVLAGLRSLVPPAITAWAIHLGWLKVGRLLALLGSVPAVVILTLLAIGELIGDKLPKAPNRTSPPGLIARIITGGLAGAAISVSGGHGTLLGGFIGSAGGLVGCFAGYKARTGLVKALAVPDFYIALVEDLVAVAGCLLIVSRS